MNTGFILLEVYFSRESVREPSKTKVPLMAKNHRPAIQSSLHKLCKLWHIILR